MLHLGKSFEAWEGGVNCSRFIKVFLIKGMCYAGSFYTTRVK